MKIMPSKCNGCIFKKDGVNPKLSASGEYFDIDSFMFAEMFMNGKIAANLPGVGFVCIDPESVDFFATSVKK